MPKVKEPQEEKLKIEDLKDPVAKLNALLQDPQYGLTTWWEFFNERTLEVYNLLKRGLMESGVIKE